MIPDKVDTLTAIYNHLKETYPGNHINVWFETFPYEDGYIKIHAYVSNKHAYVTIMNDYNATIDEIVQHFDYIMRRVMKGDSNG